MCAVSVTDLQTKLKVRQELCGVAGTCWCDASQWNRLTFLYHQHQRDLDKEFDFVKMERIFRLSFYIPWKFCNLWPQIQDKKVSGRPGKDKVTKKIKASFGYKAFSSEFNIVKTPINWPEYSTSTPNSVLTSTMGTENGDIGTTINRWPGSRESGASRTTFEPQPLNAADLTHIMLLIKTKDSAWFKVVCHDKVGQLTIPQKLGGFLPHFLKYIERFSRG